MKTRTKIHRKGLLKKFILLQVAVIFLFITHITCIEASRRIIDIDKHFEKSNIMHWTFIINDKRYNVYIDRDAETIIIYGDVETLNEKEKVEEYFKLKSPSNYKVICKLDIDSKIDKFPD